MKLLGSTNIKIKKGKNGQNMLHCASFRNYWCSINTFNIVHNDYQQDSRALYTFIPNK